jgi:hypothetical protein
MSRPQLVASRALWEARVAYRKRQWRRWRDKRPQNARTEAERKKWFHLLEEAQREVAGRNVQITKLPKARSSKRVDAVRWAHAQVGQHEVPPGSNRGLRIDIWQRKFGFLGAPWCGIFCGNALVNAGVKGVTSRIASVGAIQEDAEAHRGCFSGYTPGKTSGALRGDLVVLFGFGVHVELIQTVHSDGSVDTIGGNTSPAPGSGSEFAGGCVAERHRSPEEIHGVAHVHYG